MFAVTSHNSYMLALIFKHAAVVSVNFNQLIFVIQTARVFCEAAVAPNELLNTK
jgi:hypothetical protein